MKRERKTEATAQLRATADDGREVTIEQRTEFVRVQYEDLSWSNWTNGNRTFWLGGEKLGVVDACTMQDRRGTVFTLPPPGIG